MSRENEIRELMDSWEEKHCKKGYKRFIRDGIVCEEEWLKQKTPRVCYFLKEAYTSNENGYNLVENLHDCEHPWTMWRKIAIWTQAIHNAFSQDICEYDDEILRSHEKEIIDKIAVVNIKKSNGGSESDYDDLKKYADEDAWDNMLALWKDTLVINYYHPAVHYPNRVNYYALMSIGQVARKKYGTPVWSK